MRNVPRKKDDMDEMQKNKGEKKENTVFTKELAGMVLVLFATLMLVCLITRDVVFSTPGRYVNAFLLGVFGYTSFAVIAGMFFGGVRLVTGKKLFSVGKRFALSALTLCLIVLLLNAISLRAFSGESYGGYLSAAYDTGDKGFSTASFGGALFAIVDYPFAKLLGNAGAYAVIGILIVLSAYFTVRAFLTPAAKKNNAKKQLRPAAPAAKAQDFGLEFKDYPVENAVPEEQPSSRLYFRDDNFELKTKKEKAVSEKNNESFKILYPDRAKQQSGALAYSVNTAETPSPEDDLQKKLEYIKTPRTIDLSTYNFDPLGKGTRTEEAKETGYTRVSEPVKPTAQEENTLPPMFEHDDVEYSKDDAGKRTEAYSRYSEIEEDDESVVASPRREVRREMPQREPSRTFGAQTDFRAQAEEPAPSRIEREMPFVERSREIPKEETSSVSGGVTPSDLSSSSAAGAEVREEPSFSRDRARNLFGEEKAEEPAESNVSAFTRRREIGAETPVPSVREQAEEKKADDGFHPPVNVKYNPPPIDLFKVYRQDPNAPHEDYEERSRIIERTLSEFGIDAQVVNYIHGPTVTRYELSLPAGVSVKKVPNHADDIAMRLESENGVRIEAPIPGKNLVGIEVPNRVKTTVGLRDILESENFKKNKPGALTFALGKNLVGEAVTDNLAKGPHYLVAGATGMGKSVCLNSMIISLITKYSPEELRLILVDPKQVEFTIYNHLPHLMIDEIITNAQKAIATLQWAVEEMENRYSRFRDNEVRDIDEYNENIAVGDVPKIPKLVIIVDEVSDLMQYNKRDLEAKILSLSQKARAAGIHLVLATQRPSVDVITGVIKTNLPSRIAFRVSNAVDSGTILSEGGAEKLLGNGDMLYKNAQMPKCERIQGAFISMPEVKSVVNYIKENNESYFNEQAAAAIEKAISPQAEEAEEDDGGSNERSLSEDKLFVDALRHVINSGSASISMLQRRFSVGYSKAGALVDKMDRMGYISPFDGSRARQVLITKEEFEEKYGQL